MLYTLQEVAEMLKVSERTLYRWIKERKLIAKKVGRHWRVKEEDLKAFIEQEGA